MILCVILTHKTSRTLQPNLTIQAVVAEGLFQVIHQHSPLHHLVIHCTLLTKVCNALSQTMIQEHNCTETKL